MQNRKLFTIILVLILGIHIEVDGQTTIVKGKVHEWLTDTVYLSHLPFYSPHSSTVEYQIISKDSTFYFEWDDIDEPFIISITYLKKFSEQILESLLFENLTEKYYYGQCLKFFQNGSTMYLVEPGSILNIDLTANT